MATNKLCRLSRERFKAFTSIDDAILFFAQYLQSYLLRSFIQERIMLAKRDSFHYISKSPSTEGVRGRLLLLVIFLP